MDGREIILPTTCRLMVGRMRKVGATRRLKGGRIHILGPSRCARVGRREMPNHSGANGLAVFQPGRGSSRKDFSVAKLASASRLIHDAHTLLPD